VSSHAFACNTSWSSLTRTCAPGDADRFAKACHTLDWTSNPMVVAHVKEAYFLGHNASSQLHTCRFAPKGTSSKHRVRVIVDAQYVNEPRCSSEHQSANQIDESSPFKAVEKKSQARTAGGKVHTGSQHGAEIQFQSFGDIVYSYVEPEPKKCSAFEPCPLVVEVPGAANVPWLLLQTVYTKCSAELGVYMASVDASEDSSQKFISSVFVPLVKDFMRARADVDPARVYLVGTSRGCEIALLAAISHPGVFSFAHLSGKFLITDDIKAAADRYSKQHSQLVSIEIHVGTMDTVQDDVQSFYHTLWNLTDALGPDLSYTLRLYPGSWHAVWYAAWNAFHPVLWTGTRRPAEFLNEVPTTCRSNCSDHVADSTRSMNV